MHQGCDFDYLHIALKETNIASVQEADLLRELNICDTLRDLVPFVQIKTRKIYAWRSFTFSKIEGYSLQLY